MDNTTLNDLTIFVNALKDQLDNYHKGYKLHFDADACKRRATRIYELASGQSLTARLAAADEVAAAVESYIGDRDFYMPAVIIAKLRQYQEARGEE